MPYEQVSTLHKSVVELVDQHLLSLFVKIDHHIPTENEVEFFPERKGIHQIKPLELYDVSD